MYFAVTIFSPSTCHAILLPKHLEHVTLEIFHQSSHLYCRALMAAHKYIFDGVVVESWSRHPHTRHLVSAGNVDDGAPHPGKASLADDNLCTTSLLICPSNIVPSHQPAHT
jgi:hypothetical protein